MGRRRLGLEPNAYIVVRSIDAGSTERAAGSAVWWRYVPTPDATTPLAERLSAIANRFAGKVGFYIRHLGTGDLLVHDEQAWFPTASVIKLPLLSAFSAYVERGGASWDERVTVTEQQVVGGSGLLQHLARPHTVSLSDVAWYALCLSDNVATNLFITRVGGVRAVNRLLERYVGDGIKLLSPAMARCDRSTRSMGEATAAGIGAFLERLAAGEAPGASRLLDIAAHQVYGTMIPRYLPEPGSSSRVRRICNKTGFLPGIRGDAAVVETCDGSMVMAAFTDLPASCAVHEDPGEPLIANLAAVAFRDWFDPQRGAKREGAASTS